nr:immunoglobulin light chain junction region [Macaca mulatta]
CVQALQIPYSF